ncbi:uncharacterized protein EI90DRAFT_3041622 [Cantharellus anzutake]|uniref:uncharacterized protein n=1 Tax=Cantharellus anzutake TaxID=1750568 RepID=UPI0019084961|nr:uncharacterized protein EI90DRAFT_3041622 [Cantharellus anzutake]KAF8338095.1 hypothetical protein EI90DRAFT_3041622 [Cantharellus anzutake]
MPKRPGLDDGASEDALMEQALHAISNKQSAEAVILGLAKKFDLDLAALFFSNMNYRQMAPLVNLDPSQGLLDAPHFELYRSRIPTTLFRDIIPDIYKMLLEYGPMDFHDTLEARSRFLSPIFNCLVPCFGSHIRNTPGTLLGGRWTTKGRAEYQFIVLGIVSILFVQFKPDTGSAVERFNAIAQLIAECDAGDFANQRNDLQDPIYGILCDGETFEFFMFSPNTESSDRPSFFYGSLNTPTGREFRMSLPRFDGMFSSIGFMRVLRPICEVIFDLFLKSYIECLTQHYNISKERSKSGPNRANLGGWEAAINNAKVALDMCRRADQHRAASEWESCSSKAESGMRMLEASVIAVPRARPRSIPDELAKYEAMFDQF